MPTPTFVLAILECHPCQREVSEGGACHLGLQLATVVIHATLSLHHHDDYWIFSLLFPAQIN